MARSPRGVDEAIARFDQWSARLDGHTPAAASARSRVRSRSVQGAARRAMGFGTALVALIVATIVFSQVVGAIGLFGLFLVSLAALALLVAFSVWPSEPERVVYDEKLPTAKVVRQLETILVRRRPALPAPAARRADEIGAQLPLLESRLAELDPLDPLAQDARRLMGRDIPELLDGYERIPAEHRNRLDGAGLSVDQRLTVSLEAAREALDDLGARLSEGDRRAFETKGRFIESRYKESGDFQAE